MLGYIINEITLREYTEHVILSLYGSSFFILPVIFGFLSGRFLPAIFRISISIYIVIAGYFWCYYSDHYFQIYLIGNILYVATCIYGVKRKCNVLQKPFTKQLWLDFVLISCSTILLKLMYTHPIV